MRGASGAGRFARRELPLIFVKRVSERLWTLCCLPGGQTEYLGEAAPAFVDDLQIDFDLGRNEMHQPHVNEHAWLQRRMKADLIDLDWHEDVVRALAGVPEREEREDRLEASIEHRRM